MKSCVGFATTAVLGHILEHNLHVCKPVLDGLTAAESDHNALSCVVAGDDPCGISVLSAVEIVSRWYLVRFGRSRKNILVKLGDCSYSVLLNCRADIVRAEDPSTGCVLGVAVCYAGELRKIEKVWELGRIESY